MIELWDMTLVHGTRGEEDAKEHLSETVLHRRGDDPMVIAFRRNRELAGCNRITMMTVAGFSQVRREETRRTKADIPKEKGNTFDGWEW